MAKADVIGFVVFAVLLLTIEATFRWRERRKKIRSIFVSDSGGTPPSSATPADPAGGCHHGHHGGFGDHGGMGGHGGFDGGGHGH